MIDIDFNSDRIVDFVIKQGIALEPFDSKWISKNFEWEIPIDSYFDGISVAMV